MHPMNKKSLILLFTLVFAVILCGAVSAASNVAMGKTLSVVSTHAVNKEVSATTYPKLIDQGVTLTKEYLVKKDSLGRYSPYGTGQAYEGMKYPTKYYWKTYLYQSGMIVIKAHFYHTTLKRTIYQYIKIEQKWDSIDGGYLLYFYVHPKSWGGSGHQSIFGIYGHDGTPLYYYWHRVGRLNASFRTFMIKNAAMD